MPRGRVTRPPSGAIVATEWSQTVPLQGRFKLRANVKFHDGTPFTADDVVFSFKRAQQPSSDIKVYANAMGEPKKIDNLTVEFNLKDVDPIFLQHANSIFIMSKAWAEKNNATKTQDFNAGEQSFAAMNANGTGPCMGVSRQPELRGDLMGLMFLGLALTEAITFYALLMSFVAFFIA